MARLTLDGFVLRFPRTGIVNYVYNVVLELARHPDIELAVLLEDLNFADSEIASFIRCSVGTRLVEPYVKPGRFNKMRERYRNRKLSVRLPTAFEVARAIAPGDIYHATDWYHYAAAHARCNVLTYFDLSARLYSQFHEYTNLVKEDRKARSIRDFDHVIAISESTRRDLINHLGVPPGKISTCHLGTDPIYDAPVRLGRRDLLMKYNIDPARRYILSVSTIEPRKNIIGMLNAYRILCNDYPEYRDVVLVLSGHMGWHNESLKQFMASYPYPENVVFAGYIPLADMPSLYYHAEAFIYLSFYEGFGIPILEAMKSSCPVVCSNTSSMPEVLGDGGQLVSPHSPDEAAAALARILDDACFADSLRFAGLAQSKKFSWARHVESLHRIYNELS